MGQRLEFLNHKFLKTISYNNKSRENMFPG